MSAGERDVASQLEQCWYWCLIVDLDDRPEEPLWDRVPEERRATVQAQWLARTAPEPRRWKIWGPQIEMYRRMPGIESVTVIESVSNPTEPR